MYAVLFDIDGTLIVTGGSGHGAFAKTFAEDFGVEKIARDVPFSGRSDRAITLDLMQHAGIDTTEENWQKFKAGYLRRLPGTLEELDGCVLPGVTELLDRLAKIPDVVIGLLTGNMQEGARAKLTHYGLWDRFTFGGYGDTATNRNDIAAAAVVEARRHIGDQPLCGTMVIGDTVHDVTCGKSVSAFTVAVPTGHATVDELQVSEPHLLLNDLTEAEPLVQAITAALNEYRATA